MTTTRREALIQFGLGAIALHITTTATVANASQLQPVIKRHRRKRMRRSNHVEENHHNTHHHFKSTRHHGEHDHDHHKRHPHKKAQHLRAMRTYDTPGNRRALALTMWGEARGYGELGMRCVGHVIMNRVKADERRFGRGIVGVCYKRKQFSCHNPGEVNKIKMEKLPYLDHDNPDWLAFVEADKLAAKILSGQDKDNTGGATFYVANGLIPYWRDDMTIVGVMFGHTFFRERKRVRRRRRSQIRTKHRSRHYRHHRRRPIKATIH